MGVLVREGLCFRTRPAGIIGSFERLGTGEANDWESLAKLAVEGDEEDVGFASARPREVVVRRRFREIQYGG